MCVYDTLYTCARMLLTGARFESFQDAMNSREQTRKVHRLTILFFCFLFFTWTREKQIWNMVFEYDWLVMVAFSPFPYRRSYVKWVCSLLRVRPASRTFFSPQRTQCFPPSAPINRVKLAPGTRQINQQLTSFALIVSRTPTNVSCWPRGVPTVRQLKAEEALRAERSCSARNSARPERQVGRTITRMHTERKREEERGSTATGLTERTSSRQSDIWVDARLICQTH